MIGTRTLPFARVGAVAVALAWGAACTNSGLVGTTPTTGVPATGAPAGGTPSGSECEYTGTWAVSTAFCGSFEIDADWFGVYPETTMRITDSGAGDGSCDVAFSWSNAQCAEEEEWQITEITSSSMSVVFNGISTCNPDACTFFGSDASCVVGDRQDGSAVELGFERLQATQIRITGLLQDGYPQCTLDLTTEWVKE